MDFLKLYATNPLMLQLTKICKDDDDKCNAASSNIISPSHTSPTVDVMEDIIKNIDQVNSIQQQTILSGDTLDRPHVKVNNLFTDIELFDDQGIFDRVLDRTSLREGRGGRYLLHKILQQPTSDVTTLIRRQKMLQDIPHFSLQHILTNESSMIWMWNFLANPNEDVQSLYDAAYFSNWLLSFLNRSTKCLAISNIYKIGVAPLVGIVTPLLYFLVPYIIFRIKLRMRLPISKYVQLMYATIIKPSFMPSSSKGEPIYKRATRYMSVAFSIFFYFQGIFSSFEMSSMLQNVCNNITDRLRHIVDFTRATLDAWDKCDWDAREWTNDPTIWPHVPPREISDTERDIASLEINDKIDKFGRNLYLFKSIQKETLGKILYRAYALDALNSVRNLKDDLECVFPSYTTKSTSLLMKGVWYPMIPKIKAVTNDWEFTVDQCGQDEVQCDAKKLQKICTQNAILTGPNAGGKSTLMKGVLLSVLLAQTFGIAPCKQSMTLSPFGVISSHINVPDNQVRGESLFEAEMKRAKDCVSMLDNAVKEQKCVLIVMDEIFSSTNPIEGIAGAYATAKKLGSYKNAINIISTHYSYLAKLTREGMYNAFKMPVILDPIDNSMTRPFKLHRGISSQYVALEIMRAAGTNDDIISDAIKIKNEIMQTKKESVTKCNKKV